MSYLLIHPEDLENLLTMEDAVQAVDLAYGGATKFPVIAAPRRRVHSPAGVRLSTFPGGVPQLGIIGVTEHAEVVKHEKAVQHYENREHQVSLLHDGETAELLAVMIGSIADKLIGYTCQTALRTGATSGVGHRYLARQGAQTCGMFGTGAQAATQLL